MAAAFSAAFLMSAGGAFADDWTDARYYAASKDIPHLKTMLDRGMSVNIRNAEGWSLLMIAAEAGDVEMVKFLLSRGAYPDVTNMSGRSAFDVTASSEINALLKPAAAKPSASVASATAPKASPVPAKPKSAAEQKRSDFCQSQYRAAVAAFCSDTTCTMRENRKWSECLKTGRYN